MNISPPLRQATLIRRYQRFLADIRLPYGDIITVHCPNTGSMKNCLVPGSACWYSVSDTPRRKLPGTLEITTAPSGNLVGVNTGRPNKLVREALEQDRVPELGGYRDVRTEVRYGEENSRIDLLLSGPDLPDCFVEVKNVTLEATPGRILFPDAVTARGTRHLRELMVMVTRGHRAVLFFCVQHTGASNVGPAEKIDPEYCRTLHQALVSGVEILCYRCQLAPNKIVIDESIPFQWY